MSAALGLYRLQQIDSQLDQARARLEVIRQTIENDVELRAATDRVSAAESAAHEAERSLRNAEANAQSQRIKIEQTESSLYGGAVRNPKELQDLQNDIVSLKKHLVTLEDRLLEAMLTSDSTSTALTEAHAAFQQLESRRGSEFALLSGERTNLQRTLERFESERKAATGPLDAKAIEQYETLRRDRRGVAVTTVNDGDCAACGSPLTPAHQQSVRISGQIVRCPSCGRILFST